MATCRLKTNHIGHTGYVNTVTVSPDGSLCASGGKDGSAMLWDLNEGKHLYTLAGNNVISALAFSPNRYWLCTAVGHVIKIWDLEDKTPVDELVVVEASPDQQNNSNSLNKKPQLSKHQAKCTALAWSTDGQTLFAGFSDNIIRIWRVSVASRS